MARLTRDERRLRKKKRIARKVRGTAQKPRLCVFRSNKHIYAQLIDDENGRTVVSHSSLEKSLTGKGIEIANQVGKGLGEIAIEKGMQEIVFDRNGFQYHGRIKAVAEGARSIGLKF